MSSLSLAECGRCLSDDLGAVGGAADVDLRIEPRGLPVPGLHLPDEGRGKVGGHEGHGAAPEAGPGHARPEAAGGAARLVHHDVEAVVADLEVVAEALVALVH